MKTVAVLIVKNESKVLARCLNSVLPHVDGVLVMDTGSVPWESIEQDRILSEFEDRTGKPTVWLDGPWLGFAASRNLAMQHAIDLHNLHSTDWLFMIDADDYVEAWEAPHDDGRDGYHVTMRGDSVTYPRIQLFRVGAGWQYHGVVHEYPDCATGSNVGTLKTVVRSTREGSRNANPDKYVDDASAIYAEIQAGRNTGVLETRYAFYLAQSYRDAGMDSDAVEWYLRRAKMDGYKDEVYVSLLEAMRLIYKLEGIDNGYRLGELMLYAQEVCPHRREAVWQMMRWLRDFEAWRTVIELYECYKPPQAPVSGLFVEHTAYNEGMHDEAGIAYYYAGDHAKSLRASLTALAAYPDKPLYLSRIVDNMKFAAMNL